MANLNYRKGTTKEWDIVVTDNDVVQDPASGVLTFHVKEDTGADDPALLTLTSPAGGIVPQAADASHNNQPWARMTLTPANSTTLDPSPEFVTEYEYELLWTKTGKTFPVATGKLFVAPDL